jgi:hypothetical protein
MRALLGRSSMPTVCVLPKYYLHRLVLVLIDKGHNPRGEGKLYLDIVSPVSIISSTNNTCFPAREVTSMFDICTLPVLLVPSYDLTLSEHKMEAISKKRPTKTILQLTRENLPNKVKRVRNILFSCIIVEFLHGIAQISEEGGAT